jgi:hypothetical protein
LTLRDDDLARILLTEDNTNNKQPKLRKRYKMAQKKQNKIKVRDLKATKDVKGGGYPSPKGNKKPK